MARVSSFELYNRILEGKLPTILAELRAEGLSLEDIAYRLRDMNVQAKAGTVGRWLKEQNIAPVPSTTTTTAAKAS